MDFVRYIPEIDEEKQETNIHRHKPTIPPSQCLATRPQTDYNPKSKNRIALALQGDAGRCSMQDFSTGRTGSQPCSTGESMLLQNTQGPVQTEYRVESLSCLTTELIFDMASIAMMPLMARFVSLLEINPSAEDLHDRSLSVVVVWQLTETAY
jgi:hypothetical protein